MLEAIGLRAEEYPLEHATDYYGIDLYRANESSIAFSSVGISMVGLQPLPPKSVTTIDLCVLAVDTIDVAE